MLDHHHLNAVIFMTAVTLCVPLHLGAVSFDSPPPPPDNDNRIRFVPGGMLPEPRRVVDPLPVVTKDEWPTNIQTAVVLEISIDERGRVESVLPLKPRLLDENHPIIVAVRNWRYESPVFNEKPVRVLTLLFFTFSEEHGVYEKPYQLIDTGRTKDLTPHSSGPSPAAGPVR